MPPVNLSLKRLITFIVSLALFMEALDTTIINTAIPAMARSLVVNPINLKIALISYLLSLAIFIPISGWTADKWGVKRVFICAIGIFTLSSLWCGYAHDLTELVIARAAQGIGGALALPVGRLIILRTFERHEVVYMMAKVVMVASLGMMLGPLLGGLITAYFSWRWIFWVNIPVGLFTMIMARFWLPAMPPVAVPSLDKLGFVLFGASLAAFTFSMSALSECTLPLSMALTVMTGSVIAIILYVVHSYRHPHPIVKTELFRFRTFQVSAVGNLISRLGFGGVPFLVPILLQVVLSYSSVMSGLLMAPMAVGVLFTKSVSLHLLQFFGYKKLLIINTILLALSLWSFSLINNETSFAIIAMMTFIFGLLIAMQNSGMTTLAYAEVPADYLSAATSFMSTLMQIALSLGVAVGALLIHYYSGNVVQGYLLTSGVFHHAFLVMGAVTLFSTLVFTRLKPEDGKQMLGK